MLNQCQFIGNLGRDPETRTFSNGNKVCNLRIACSETWRDKQTGERKEKTEWISVALFSEGLIRVAEQYLRKGSKVYVSGKMVTRKWQNQEGKDQYSTEIVLQGFDSKLVMLDGASGKPSGDGYEQGGASGGYGGPPAGDMDDSIPF